MTKKNQATGQQTGNIFQRQTIAFPRASHASDVEREIALKHYTDGDLARTEAHCRHLITSYPRDGFGWKVLGASLKLQNRIHESLEPMQNAAKLMPGDWEAFNNLGLTLDALGNLEQAQACFEHALALKPDFREALRNIAENLRRQQKLTEALAVYQRTCVLEPTDGYARHMADTLGGQSSSDRAPDQYVAKVFDDYADNFEQHLSSDLQYRVPTQLVELLSKTAEAPTEGWDVLDLGCGTGLVGDAIAHMTRSLAGVDLSSKMLEKARGKGTYQRLVCDEVTSMLKREPSESLDVIVSADVFIYVGRLDEVVAQAHRTLRPGGRLAFSIETLEDKGDRRFKLERTGRFSQSLSYIDELIKAHDFQAEAIEACMIRHEAGAPVLGHLFVLRR